MSHALGLEVVAEGARLVQVFRTANRAHVVRQQVRRFAPRERSGAKTQLDVGFLRSHVVHRYGHLQDQLDVRVGAAKRGQPGQQQLAREGGCNGDAQACRADVDHRRLSLQRAQGLAHPRQIGSAVGTCKKVAATGEQLEPQPVLQLADAVADRAGRDVQFLGRLRDAAQARHRLEGEQRLDRRDVGDGCHACIVARTGKRSVSPVTSLRHPRSPWRPPPGRLCGKPGESQCRACRCGLGVVGRAVDQGDVDRLEAVSGGRAARSGADQRSAAGQR